MTTEQSDVQETETETQATNIAEDSQQQPIKVPVKSAGLLEDLAEESQLAQILVSVEAEFAKRIEGVKIQDNQIIVVLDEITDSDEKFTEPLQSAVPIVLLDPRSMRQLQKLSPDGWQSIREETSQSASQQVEKQPNPWHKVASDKCEAARIISQQGVIGAMDLLSAAVCARVTAVKDNKELFTTDAASLELYTNDTLLSVLSARETETYNKVFNLSRLNTQLPESLINTILAELESSLVI